MDASCLLSSFAVVPSQATHTKSSLSPSCRCPPPPHPVRPNCLRPRQAVVGNKDKFISSSTHFQQFSLDGLFLKQKQQLQSGGAFQVKATIGEMVPAQKQQQEGGGEEKRAEQPRPMRVIISGAPASGKGTQCAEIVNKFGLAHVSAGDLLRAEVAMETEYGKRVKEYMDRGSLVPDDVVIPIVKSRLAQPDAMENGWLLDGYPRSASQAAALEKAGIRPDVFIVLQVPDEIIVDRVVGRRMDPLTNTIYHLKYSPPPPEIVERLVQRSDDTEQRVVNRLKTHHENEAAVLDVYKKVLRKVDGNRKKAEVFEDISNILEDAKLRLEAELVLEMRLAQAAELHPHPHHMSSQLTWVGMPTRLNDIPHSREIRQYFYRDCCEATSRAVDAGIKRMRLLLTIPELNPEMDVYRIGTLLELMRELAFTFANDGNNVRVCVQGSMGSGVFSGMPLQLAGTRRMLEVMDWTNESPNASSVRIGAIGEKEVQEDDDIFILMAPQNAVGNCILDDLEKMVEAAGEKPVILLNPRLKDIPSSGGVMQISGRDRRQALVDTFLVCYNFRLLYLSGTQYPILGALRMAYPGPYQLYKREDVAQGKETYKFVDVFDTQPTSSEIADAFVGKRKSKEEPRGLLGFLSKLI
eukprot:TRINITY_DN7257_c0_g1_i2.p1 TRINITY_DN7257_c0_g1~~TRINITY_DN7257_c0_g1_i2.p1  ORF type:complete len:649 (-),score=216.76 TRINITY_DN7257_c0_g1_i2:222-2132(-)